MVIGVKGDRDLTKARNYVLRLLKFRQRSEKEIRDKLKQKNYDSKTIDEAVSHFKKIKFIDDEEFVKGWINSRIKKPLGLQAIKLELVQKGVREEIIEKSLKEKKLTFDESNALRELMSNRLNKLIDRYESEDVKHRLSTYFIRRGFSANTVYETINRLLPR